MCPFSPATPTARSTPQDARQQFDAFIRDPDFPCVGARSALNRGRIRHAHFDRLGDPSVARPLRDALAAFSAEFSDPGTQPVSFVATFSHAVDGEQRFERLMWQQLQLLHDVDDADWDPSVSDDPADAEFSMSIAGRAFFVVGLHPDASRLARRSPLPSLVFNFHDQFEQLKASGKYATMQTAIRARDTALQGSINPVLSRFGEASEARQYSGRAVGSAWTCPFTPRKAAHV